MQNEAQKVLGMEQHEPNSVAFQAFGLGNVKNVTVPFKVWITMIQGDWNHRTVLCAVTPVKDKLLDVAAICGTMANPKEARRHSPRSHQEFLLPAFREAGAIVKHHDYDSIANYIEIVYQYPTGREYVHHSDTEFFKHSTGIEDAEWKPVETLPA
jgi:hypothetical protein